MVRSSVLGGMFGVLLLTLAFFAAGGGHGVYFPLGVVSAPLSLLGIPAALVGVIPLWAALGGLSAGTEKIRRWVGVALVLQNVAAVAVMFVGPFADMGYLQGRGAVLPFAATMMLLYLGAQVVLWMAVSHKRNARG